MLHEVGILVCRIYIHSLKHTSCKNLLLNVKVIERNLCSLFAVDIDHDIIKEYPIASCIVEFPNQHISAIFFANIRQCKTTSI